MALRLKQRLLSDHQNSSRGSTPSIIPDTGRLRSKSFYFQITLPFKTISNLLIAYPNFTDDSLYELWRRIHGVDDKNLKSKRSVLLSSCQET